MSTSPYAPPKASVDDIVPNAEASPALWNPNAAASWSLFLSPIFGAVLHMKNWQALGETEKARQSKVWVIVCIAFFAVLAIAAVLLPESKGVDLGFRAGAFGLLIAWYTQSARPQARHIAGRFGTSYPKRGWGKPLLYALLCFLGYLVVVFVFALIAALIAGEGW